MLYGAGMILLLVVLGGLIAYIGDRVGMKVGKRRVSMFGLRPKHTSIIVTIVTGIVIVSLTIGALLIVSKQSRTAFFGIQELQNNLADIKGKYRLEEKKLKKSLEDNSIVLEESRTALEASRAALENKQAELDDIIGEINIRALELSNLQKATDEMASKVLELNNERRELEEKKQQLEKQIDTLEDRYTTMLGETSQEVLYGDILYRKGQPLARVAIPKGISEADMRTLLWNAMNDVFRNAAKAGATVEEDIRMIFESQFASLVEAIKKRNGDTILELRSHTNVLKNQPLHVTWNIVENALVFKKGQVMGREIVQPGLAREKINAILSGMLADASAEAKGAGMIPGPDGSVGTIPQRRYDEVVTELLKISGPHTIELFVVDNVRISDTLSVDFKII